MTERDIGRIELMIHPGRESIDDIPVVRLGQDLSTADQPDVPIADPLVGAGVEPLTILLCQCMSDRRITFRDYVRDGVGGRAADPVCAAPVLERRRSAGFR